MIKNHKFTLAYGSSRGGKSWVFIYALVIRALTYAGSNHAVIRLTAASVESTIWPTVMKILEAIAPGFRAEVDINKVNRRITLPNGSVIWFFGANDEDQIFKIMGSEFATIFLNEVVDLDHKTYTRILTRLNVSPSIVDDRGTRIKLKLFADCNPKAKSHWVHQLWKEKLIPGSKKPINNPEAFGWLRFDRDSNPDVDEDYYKELENASAEEQASFLEGEWYDEIQGAYFSKADIDANRDDSPSTYDFDLIGIGVDPAVSDAPTSDETGIFVCGMKRIADHTGEEHNHYYPLEDLSGRYHPNVWAEIVAKAYHRWGAAFVVVEINQGGLMNVTTLETADARLNILTVRPGVGQGKNLRAQPIAGLMKAGRVHHPFATPDGEVFAELEDQMIKMTGDYDRKRQKSPDRLDAYAYCIGELMNGDNIARPIVISKVKSYFN